jgi:hypothetical protein
VRADQWGHKRFFLAALLILPLRGALYTLSDNEAWLVGVQLLDGIGTGIFGAIFPVMVADLRSRRNRLCRLLVCPAGDALAGPREPKRERDRLRLSLPDSFERAWRNAIVPPHEAIPAWSVVAVATAGVIIRPFRLPEAVWALACAAILVLLGLLPVADAIAGIARGIDVYLFLIGMMLIAELAQREGLFDYLAAFAVEHARGSPQRLFLLVYIVGMLVTVFLSNDANAIVLTPAVYAATRAAGASPLPYLFVHGA